MTAAVTFWGQLLGATCVSCYSCPMTLTSFSIKQARPAEKIRRLYDERGLYLEISPKGGKWWRFKYRFAGKEKRLSLGVYPDVGLKEARTARDEARKLVAQGVDPSVVRKNKSKQQNTDTENAFESVAREWFHRQSVVWSDVHQKNVLSKLENDVFPWLGREIIGGISAPQLLRVIRKIEDRGAIETAHRTLSICGQILRYGIATGRAERDVASDLKGALQPVRREHLAAIIEPARFGELLREIYDYSGTPAVRCALRLAPLVFLRPGELRTAKWSDIDLSEATWSFVVRKTKTPLIIPLASQTVNILQELKPVSGKYEYVFPNGRSPLRPMSENAVLAALRRLGIPKEEMCGHGFRASARTMLDEQLGVRPEVIEHQLAHKVKDPLGRAYNRTEFLEDRRQMMQRWADYIDELRGSTNSLA